MKPCEPPQPRLVLLYRAEIEVAPPQLLGLTPAGERRIYPILGGRFDGERLRGRILPGGADWQIVRETAEHVEMRVEARFTMETQDGALIYVQNQGIRRAAPEQVRRMMGGETVDPAGYYFRMTPRFETGDPRYDWLNGVMAVASGMRGPASVAYDVYAVE
ncbi:MAG: DUF3237 domain-containing protein [Rhodocyclaceae bacterium]|jgi:hypothetical protein|nr:DUF3237 domain-containing protein [Rhodocyclaceae bacterium]